MAQTHDRLTHILCLSRIADLTHCGCHTLSQITRVAKGYAEARKLRTLAPHQHAVPPPCPHFGPCGGCSLQSMAYEQQLKEKQNQVRLQGLPGRSMACESEPERS